MTAGGYAAAPPPSPPTTHTTHARQETLLQTHQPTPGQRRRRHRHRPGRRAAAASWREPPGADHATGYPGARQPELPARHAARPNAAGRLHPAREGDALRPRAHSRAHRARARQRRARLLRADGFAGRLHHRRHPDAGRPEDPRLRALFHRGRRSRLRGHAARRARLRGQVLHPARQLGPGGQQHSGVLHSGRDEVPRPDPRGEDGTRPGLSAGGQRARHVLGFHLADARVAAHGDVGHERPHHPAQPAHDGRFRHPLVPPHQCRG